MILVGRNLSPFVRRVAVSLRLLDIPHESRPLATTTERDAIRTFNPLVRVPALVLDDGEVLVDSAAILDYLDELAGPERALIPPSGPRRRQVLRLVAFAAGAAEKGVSGYYELTRRPQDKIHLPWADQCKEQVAGGLSAVEAEAAGDWLVGDRLTQADVTAVCAFEFVRKVLPDVVPEGRFPRLEALSARCHRLEAFDQTRP